MVRMCCGWIEYIHARMHAYKQVEWCLGPWVPGLDMIIQTTNTHIIRILRKGSSQCLVFWRIRI